MIQPRELATQVEMVPSLPGGTEERFSGYGVMGLPFRSGHVLGMRRFPSSSIGPGYTSAWHRGPSRDWTFYQDVAAEEACPRYFGPLLRRSVRATIQVEWTGPTSFTVGVNGGATIRWEVELAAPRDFRTMNLLASLVPEALWHSETMLRTIPQRGLFVVGQAYFEPFDPARHRREVHAEA